jgi:hypothetical protein
MFNKVVGTDRIAQALVRGDDFGTIVGGWQAKLREFIAKREGYLLYE